MGNFTRAALQQQRTQCLDDVCKTSRPRMVYLDAEGFRWPAMCVCSAGYFFPSLYYFVYKLQLKIRALQLKTAPLILMPLIAAAFPAGRRLPSLERTELTFCGPYTSVCLREPKRTRADGNLSWQIVLISCPTIYDNCCSSCEKVVLQSQVRRRKFAVGFLHAFCCDCTKRRRLGSFSRTVRFPPNVPQ